MANINETIAKVDKLDPDLARQIRKYVHDHNYGLVFEHNLPEAVRLYTKTATVGDTVNIRPDRGEKEKDENKIAWNVKDIQDGMATIENGKDERKITIEDLVPIVSYHDVIYPGLREVDRIEHGDKDDPYQVVINAENYHALEMLTYCYAGKVDCIYIDPPYNTGAKDWKYNNDYVDGSDQYRHSKWLAFMERRLKLAKRLLNPKDSVLIVTIDEKEQARLGLLLEQMFPEARLQIVDTIINRKGVSRKGMQDAGTGEEVTQFSRVSEYIYFVMFGKASVVKTACNMLDTQITDVDDTVSTTNVQWLSMLRRGAASHRADKPKHFYPIFVNPVSATIEGVGEPLESDEDRSTVAVPENLVAVWPMRTDGSEGRWQLKRETFISALEEGTAKLGSYNKKQDRWAINYLNAGIKDEIKSGAILVKGKDEKGALILKRVENKRVEPKSVWNQVSHNASEYGTTLLNGIIGSDRFSYPKSLYAVKDTVGLFVADKPNALIIDFFAGSGTTLHAVNLLNAEDGGHRCCICVTNNEVSADEAKKFTADGFRQGDPEWEERGIARYVTWPRTKCSIEGIDVNGNPLKGNYLGSDTPMSDGFKANAIFFDLTYESAWPIRLDNAFDAIAPILWMQAGARGPIIKRVGKSYLITDYYGVLFDYGQASKFVEAIKKHPNIKTAFVVTDDQRHYSNMCRRLPGIEVHRLYETFLKTFEICGEGGLD